MFELTANTVGIAYLMVLAVLGYAVLLAAINKFIRSNAIRISLVTAHFALGIIAIMIFPSVHYRNTLAGHGDAASLLFAAIVLIGMVVVFRTLIAFRNGVEWK